MFHNFKMIQVTVYCVFLLNILISSVYCAGLKELFTWTRITYACHGSGPIGRSEYLPVGHHAAQHFGNWQHGTLPQEVENRHNSMCQLTDTNYNYINNIPQGANVWKDKLFISVPRRRPGIPSTLNYIPLNSRNKHNVPLIPYPSWTQNSYEPGHEDRFVSAYRIAIDECDRLWFADTGILETAENKTKVKPHELVIIDLNTDAILGKYVFPDSVTKPVTILSQLTVDATKDRCEDAYAYFPDLAGNALIVFSLSQSKFWRVEHSSFSSEPLANQLNIDGYSFQWNDGIFSIMLSDIKPDGYRDVYYHALASTHMYRVSSKVLKNEALATRADHGDDFQLVGNKGPKSQSSTGDLHKPTGLMFLGMPNLNAVACWNTNDADISTLSLVDKDDKKMIYPTDVKVYKDHLVVLTNTLPRFIYGKLNYDEINFRIWTNTINEAVKGTRCDNNWFHGY